MPLPARRRIFHRRPPAARQATWVLVALCLFLLGAGGGALLASEARPGPVIGLQ